jgi:hypothetical protein
MDSSIQGKSTWLTEGKNKKIFFILKNDEVLDFHISFLGNHISGGKNKDLLIGKINRTEDLEPWISWELLKYNAWSYTLPTLAKQFINQVTEIPDSAKKLLETAIETSITSRHSS